MRKIAVTMSVISALLVMAVAGRFFVSSGKANPILVKPAYTEISIQYPREEIYNSSVVALNFTVKTNSHLGVLYSYGYVLDGTIKGTVKNCNVTGTKTVYNDQPDWTGDKPTNYYYYPYAEYTLEGSAVLTDLSDGWHNITVYKGNIDDFLYSDTIRFSVDTSIEDKANSAGASAFPVMPVLAGIVIAAAALVAGLLLFTRGKRRRG